MAWTIDKALDDELITVVSRNDSVGLFVILLGELETEITIELNRHLDSDMTKFQVSHAIKTPKQAGPYRTGAPYGDYPAYALHKAITGLTQYYKDAVKEGHKPTEDWLLPNY